MASEEGFSISPFRAGDVGELKLQPAQARWAGRLEAGTLAVLEAGLSWTVRADERVIAIGGVLDRGEGRGEAWALLSTAAGRRLARLTRTVRRAFVVMPFRRIEAVTAEGFAPAARWARMLGFRDEGVMRAWRQDGGDARRWAWINSKRP
jgi:hypothetical protein